MRKPPYTVRLGLQRAVYEDSRKDRYDVTLKDFERVDIDAAGTAFLELREQKIPDHDLIAAAFLAAFIQGDGGTEEDGIRFGRRLLDCLLADSPVRKLWDDVARIRTAQGRPLRLEVRRGCRFSRSRDWSRPFFSPSLPTFGNACRHDGTSGT